MKCPNCQHHSQQTQKTQALFELCVRCGSMWIDYRSKLARGPGLDAPRPAEPIRRPRREARVS